MLGGVTENVIHGASKFLTSVVISRTLHNFEPIKKAPPLPDSSAEHEDEITDKIRKQKNFEISKTVTLMMSFCIVQQQQ